MNFFQCISLVVLLISAAGCRVESARPEKEKSLVIASDYLEAKDSVLFRSYEKKHRVHITIKHIDSEELIDEFKALKYNSGYDLVMMQSLHSIIALNNAGVLHSMKPLTEEFPDSPYISDRYNYSGFAFDPFVFASDPDTISAARTYGDLKNTDFINTLNEQDLITLLSPLLHKMNKVQSYNWIKSFYSHKYEADHPDKFKVQSIPLALTTYSHARRFDTDTILSKCTQIYYPNSNTTGTFFNLKTICIINQASNYSTAMEFTKAFMDPDVSTKVCNALHIFPVNGKNTPFRAYNVRTEKLIQYYGMIRRILNKLM